MNPNSLTVPCPLCGAVVTVVVDDVEVKVVPPERGKGLKRAALTITAIGVTSHVHGRNNQS